MTTSPVVSMLGAPSNIGIRPYDDGTLRGLDRAPSVLRSRGLVERLHAQDLGDVVPPPYVDYVRPPHGVRNESALMMYTDVLAHRVADAGRDGQFIVVVGGDCSIVVGSMLGARRMTGKPVGLAYVDAHADFATPQESATGSAASMCLSMVVGRGDTPLARILGDAPLALPSDVVLLGRRDAREPYGHEGLRALHVHDVPYADIRARGVTSVLASATRVLEQPHLDGFWVHVDADVFDASVMQAVDSPTPDGPRLDELLELVIPLVNHPRALGMQLTIYDPTLDDANETCGQLLVEFLARAVASRGSAT
ncbi:MAG: arginase family protein [bacterium]